MRPYSKALYARNCDGRRFRRLIDCNKNGTWFYDGTSLNTKSLIRAKRRARRLFELFSTFTA
jgi:hypothetical protein